tara:strand:+ start:510 stop:1571 length:1062 start_codon:yes stop_codon:yes gene_type:complete
MKKIIAEAKSLLALILIILFLKETVVEAYVVPTSSMEENILRGDFLIGSRYVYGMKVPEKIWIPFTAISIPTFLPEYRFPAFKEVERGDVVVFEYPRDPVYKFVKRCIAIGGDTISIDNRTIYVNGEPVLLPQGGKFTYKQDSLNDPDIFLGVEGNKDQYPEITVPKKGDLITLDQNMDWKLNIPLLLYEGNNVELREGNRVFTFTNMSPRDIYRRTGDISIYKEYFLPIINENGRLISTQSRDYNVMVFSFSLDQEERNKYIKALGKNNHPLRKENIKNIYINGKPIDEVKEYELKQDYFWMMGDNRDNSEDSRFWGFVPKNNILGQPIVTWFSINLDNYIPRLSRIGKIPN